MPRHVWMRSIGRVRTSAPAVVGAALALGCLGGLGVEGCGHAWNSMPAGSYERGYAEYEGGYYTDAVRDLKLFVRRSPNDEQADDAQYAIAMSYFENEDYPVAAVEFQILRADYPTSDLAETAFYQEGLCYVKQVPDIQLDQSNTHKAIDHFERYLQQFPQGEHRQEVTEELEELHEHLDRKELATARLYQSLGKPQAAKVTLEALMRERPDSALRPRMLLALARADFKLGEKESARKALQEILTRFPGDRIAGPARRMMTGGEDALDESGG